MDSLDYIKASRDLSSATDGVSNIKINLVTNFTDGILGNIFEGVNLVNNIRPTIYRTPYRQYHFELKNPQSELYTDAADITFVFFNLDPFKNSEFQAAKNHFDEVLADIERYCEATKGTVVLNRFIVSYRGAYGNLFKNDPFFNLVQDYNERLDVLASRTSNLIIFDTNRIVHLLGESHVFDLRGLYAFDVPFTHEFMAILAEEWFVFIRAIIGRSKKAIILDLDNTLWGGIVGELGPLGIALGPDYPGNAYKNFQRALRNFYDRGIILAIVSKNNEQDVTEVFEKNSHMELQKKHFAAIRANWDEKAQNILDIANELNIGTDSMVFLDDDPLTRELVRAKLPGVAVPDFSLPPEEYVNFLYGLNYFNQSALTREDMQKGKMYAEERQRKEVLKTVKDVSEYIAELGVVMSVRINAEDFLPRIAQLTQKTNQFNLTTNRYSEHDIKKMIAEGAWIFSADVSDKFGDYGTVAVGIVIPVPGSADREATLDTFLMSCRVMGRGIECAFIDHIIHTLHEKGITKLSALFVPTAKNEPAKSFLDDHAFTVIGSDKNIENAPRGCVLNIPAYIKNPCAKLTKAITITNNQS